MPLGSTVVVGPGDTLWAIAKRYDRTVAELLFANPQITDRSLIRVGDKISITRDDVHVMWNATLDLPGLPFTAADVVNLLPGCLQGRVTFAAGRAFPPGAEHQWYNGTWIEGVVRTDVDHDGTTDLVALIKCMPSQGSFDRVVAFRERADGTFATIGLVLQEDWSGDDAHYYEDIDEICGIEPAPNGEIRIAVGDWTSMIPGVVHILRMTQWRQYGWDGHAFVQTAGPTRFVVPSGMADLTLEASPMTYAKPVGGTRSGTMTVTVRNAGAAAVEDVSVVLEIGPSDAVCTAAGAGDSSECEIGRLEPGAAATVAFRQSVPEGESQGACASGVFTNEDYWWGFLQLRISGMQYSDAGVRRVCK